MNRIFAACLLVFAPPVWALEAPFCLVSNSGFAQCFYYSLSACHQAARSLGGMCAANIQQSQQQVQQPVQQPRYNAFGEAQSNVMNGARYVQQGIEDGRRRREEQIRAQRDAELYAQQMELLRLQQNQARAVSQPTGAIPTGGAPASNDRPLFTYFPEATTTDQHPVEREQPPETGREADALQIELLKTQLEQARLELARTKRSLAAAKPIEDSRGSATFTGKRVKLSTDSVSGTTKWNCEYTSGGKVLWQPAYGSCPSSVNLP